MSTNLYYEPHSPKAQVLGTRLKYIIAQKYFNHDGSISSEHIYLSEGEIPYFEGLGDAGVEDADKLVEVIKKHKGAWVWIAE